nr:putative F-box protein At3g52320 [Ipomoea batatas]
MSLPEDMIAEILSRLPVESLLRFNCVCKKWRQLIHQDDFIEKHHRPRRHGKLGLILEQEYRKGPTERLRIRNPATRQTVYLPDFQVGNKPPTWVVARMFFVAKLSEESVFLGRFRAVTVGVDAAWRPLKNFPHNFIDYFSIALPIGDIRFEYW